MQPQQKELGARGGMYFDSTTDTVIDSYMIEANEDSVIATLEETGDVNVLGAAEWNLSGKTLGKGLKISPKREAFTKVKLTSGSLIIRNS